MLKFNKIYCKYCKRSLDKNKKTDKHQICDECFKIIENIPLTHYKMVRLQKKEVKVLMDIESIIKRPLPLINTTNLSKVNNTGFSVQTTSIVMLKLVGLELISLPISICQLTKLQVLNLFYNKLNSLPSCLRNLQNLKILYADQNYLTFLPKSIKFLKNLETIFLNNNLLSSFPDEFKSLSKLQNIHINHNRLWQIPKSIMNMKNLRYLDLRFNLFNSYSNLNKKMNNKRVTNQDIQDIQENKIKIEILKKKGCIVLS